MTAVVTEPVKNKNITCDNCDAVIKFSRTTTKYPGMPQRIFPKRIRDLVAPQNERVGNILKDCLKARLCTQPGFWADS